MRRYIIALFAFISLSSFKDSQGPTPEEKAAVVNAVRETLQNYYSDIRANGLTAEFHYLDSSADFFWVPPGYSSALSYDSVAFILKKNAPLFRSIDNRPDTLRIIALSKRLAAYNARISSMVIDKNGKGTMTFLIETGVLIKRENGWKLLSGQTSAIQP